MKVRTVAGLGMMLLAAGLLIIFVLGEKEDAGDFEQLKPAQVGIPQTMETDQEGPAEVDAFLASYNENYRRLWTDFEGTNWDASVDINAQSRFRTIG